MVLNVLLQGVAVLVMDGLAKGSRDRWSLTTLELLVIRGDTLGEGVRVVNPTAKLLWHVRGRSFKSSCLSKHFNTSIGRSLSMR